MTDIAIRVEGIGKLYRVGERESYQHLRTWWPVPFAALATARGGPRTPSGRSAMFPSTSTKAKWSA